MANLVQLMKQKIAQSGGSRSKVLYFKPDTAKRIRFLQELDTGEEFLFHSDFNNKVYELCKDPEDHEDCPLCQQGVTLKSEYCWSVWDYDANEVRIFKSRVTSQSAAPALISMYDEFGTIMDRDYKIKKVGTGQSSSFTVLPLEKEKFRIKAKPFNRAEMLDILTKAYTTDQETDDEVEEEKPKKSKKAKKAKKTLKERFLGELDYDEVKDIALDFGMTKKELKSFDEVEDLIDELFDNYEEDDLQEAYDELQAEKETEEENED